MRVFSNNATTLLDAPIVDSDTILLVEDASPFSTPAAGTTVHLTLEDTGGNIEIVRLVSVNEGAFQLTVVRGDDFDAEDPDKMPSLAFAAGTRVELRMTAGGIERFVQRIGDTIDGGVDFTTPQAEVTAVQLRRDNTALAVPPSLLEGELALDLRGRKLWAGVMVPGSGAAATVEILAQIAVQTTTPTEPSVGQLWFNYSTNVLSVYYGAAWIPVHVPTTALNWLLLANNVAARGNNAAVTDTFDLIKVAADDTITVGDRDAVSLFLNNNLVQLGSILRLVEFLNQTNYWSLVANTPGGAPNASLTPNQNNSAFYLYTRAPGGAFNGFVFQADGTLFLPTTLTAGHAGGVAAPKAYVDAKSPYAMGRVSAAGGEVGDGTDYTVAKGGTGIYNISLAIALSSQDNMVVLVTPNVVNGTYSGVSATAVPTSNSTFTVYIGGGNVFAYADLDFDFVVFDSGAI